MTCPRCSGRLLIGRPDYAGSDISCLACGYQPLTPQEAATREVAKLDKRVTRLTRYKGMPI